MPHNLYERDVASQSLGMSLDRVEPGTAQVSMTVRLDMLNGHGTCHGGIIFTLADTAFAYACNARHPSVAAHCSISFLAPALANDRLIASATEAALQGGTGIYDVTVKNQGGDTLALFRGVSRRLRPGTPAPGGS